jgi:hypothetical protein
MPGIIAWLAPRLAPFWEAAWSIARLQSEIACQNSRNL